MLECGAQECIGGSHNSPEGLIADTKPNGIFAQAVQHVDLVHQLPRGVVY